VFHLENRLEEEYRLQLIQYKKELTSWKIEHKSAEKRYRQVCDLSPKNPLRLEALEILNACTGREPEKPVRKRFTISDATSEALRKELGLEYPNLVIASDEAGGNLRVICIAKHRGLIPSGAEIELQLSEHPVRVMPSRMPDWGFWG
jgi:hypothetical protein